ncbi:hypothetical protein LPJ74_002857 [Coemansia sp. RSA 1843]|nr:hypothetical protein LPJ74_002857 [Coemansia sp. RSA 1843]
MYCTRKLYRPLVWGTPSRWPRHQTTACRDTPETNNDSDVIKDSDKPQDTDTLKEPQERTFLRPQIKQYGVWAKWAYKDKATGSSAQEQEQEQEQKYKPLDTPWTLAERRALFMYYRAISVSVRRDPDWEFVGSRLERDPGTCKFVSTYITYNWAGHVERAQIPGAGRYFILANIVAGIGLGQLRRLAQGVEDPVAVVGPKIDAQTLEWLLKLVAWPSEDTLWLKRKPSRIRWSEYEERLLLDECLVLRLPVESDFTTFLDHWGRAFPSLVRQFCRIVDAEIDAHETKGTCIKPLTADELRIIEDAKKSCYPNEVRWADVRDKLKGRTFAQVILQTTNYTRGVSW